MTIALVVIAIGIALAAVLVPRQKLLSATRPQVLSLWLGCVAVVLGLASSAPGEFRVRLLGGLTLLLAVIGLLVRIALPLFKPWVRRRPRRSARKQSDSLA
jgi:hypothetical protein